MLLVNYSCALGYKNVFNFREHLGLLKNSDLQLDISDPVSESFFKEEWLKIASRNTATFEKVR